MILLDKAIKFTKRHDSVIMNNNLPTLYYECHITIDPILEESERDKLQELIKPYGFKLAKLLMQKRKEDLPEQSKYDTFMTAHEKVEIDMIYKMYNCLKLLKRNGYVVRRYKIENIIIDSRINDRFELL